MVPVYVVLLAELMSAFLLSDLNQNGKNPQCLSAFNQQSTRVGNIWSKGQPDTDDTYTDISQDICNYQYICIDKFIELIFGQYHIFGPIADI